MLSGVYLQMMVLFLPVHLPSTILPINDPVAWYSGNSPRGCAARAWWGSRCPASSWIHPKMNKIKRKSPLNFTVFWGFLAASLGPLFAWASAWLVNAPVACGLADMNRPPCWSSVSGMVGNCCWCGEEPNKAEMLVADLRNPVAGTVVLAAGCWTAVPFRSTTLRGVPVMWWCGSWRRLEWSLEFGNWENDWFADWRLFIMAKFRLLGGVVFGIYFQTIEGKTRRKTLRFEGLVSALWSGTGKFYHHNYHNS